MATGTKTSPSPPSRRKHLIPPGLAWLTVFVPALSYFLVTRLHFSDGRSSLGRTVTDHVESPHLETVFYVSPTTLELRHALHVIDDTSSLGDIVASVWKHDSELGRGYLLMSQARGAGRIWRWERGGGPIPIGKTLAMDPSGCRSHRDCGDRDGSGGLAVDFHAHDAFREGRLVVAEWGEGRVVRLEDETGARTPLIIRVPDACGEDHTKTRRVERPTGMLYTPHGDLLFLESPSSSCHTVMRLRHAVSVPPLQDAMESRMAHKWNTTHHNHPIEIVYHNVDIGSMALDATGMGLYVTVRQDDSVLLVHLSLLEDDEDDKEESARNEMGVLDSTAKIAFNLTDANVTVPPQAMAVDDKGHIFLATSSGILVLGEGKVLGTLATPTTSITSLTLGEDGYLYMTAISELLRIRVRHGPPKIPTNLVKKLSAAKHT